MTLQQRLFCRFSFSGDICISLKIYIYVFIRHHLWQLNAMLVIHTTCGLSRLTLQGENVELKVLSYVS